MDNEDLAQQLLNEFNKSVEELEIAMTKAEKTKPLN